MGGIGNPLLLVHATGFAALVYQELANLLADSFTVFGVDLRFQGNSERSATGSFSWSNFGDDVLTALLAIRRQYPSGTPIYGFGHSCGGLALLASELKESGLVESLYLYEPIIVPAEMEDTPYVSTPLANLTIKRREVFPSRQQAFENFSRKPPIMSFSALSQRSYVEHCLRELPSGEVTLSCAKEDEAAIYNSMASTRTYSRLKEISVPTVISWGSNSDAFSGSYYKTIASVLPSGNYEEIADVDHFGPMCVPAVFAERIKVALKTS
jgi:pimeloyl-ACP methyl ester carboxylesterase